MQWRASDQRRCFTLCVLLASGLCLQQKAEARAYFFPANPYTYVDATTGTAYNSTISGYFNYNSSISNDTTTTPSPYGSAEVTVTRSVTNGNNAETYTSWAYYNVGSTYTRMVLWNATNSLQLTLTSPLNETTPYLAINTLTSGGIVNRSCSNKPTSFTIGGAANNYTCAPGGVKRADLAFTGATNIVPSPAPLLGLLPFLWIRRRLNDPASTKRHRRVTMLERQV